jgi:uncharacterized protein YbcC (UPF0753/DUF2309 family)
MPLSALQSFEASRALDAAVEAAVRSIPPLWPLASSVAVNPFLGQAGESLAQAGARLGRVAGLRVTPPRRWYQDRIASGLITDADLSDALASADKDLRPADLDILKAAARVAPPPPRAAPTLADLAAEASGLDWPGLIAERLGAWAGGWFDEGQAVWTAPRTGSAFAAWRATAMHDLTPGILGLAGFSKHVAETPDGARGAIAQVVRTIELPPAARETYFHQLLMTLGGWAQYARRRRWEAERNGGSDETVVDLLAIRLVWEAALFAHYAERIDGGWRAAVRRHAAPVTPTRDLVVDAILQDACERAGQRRLSAALADPTGTRAEGPPALQAAFCIDVRSEVFRRSLEAQSPGVHTHGFAGFFGMATAHRPFASDVAEHRLPVLIAPRLASCSGGPEDAAAARAARIRARAGRAWGRFQRAAVSSFAFVEAAGPLYAWKLLRDALGLAGAPQNRDPAPRLDPGMELTRRTEAAETVLRSMSLTKNFARLVLLVGHGAALVNNPHASALRCGACGGHSGEVNARLLAALLNDPAVRASLAERGVRIPTDTLFLGALHDTTSDAVTLYAEDHPSPSHQADIGQARAWLDAAGRLARAERALRLPRAAGGSRLARRSRDWAEIRPEWGLAGCQAFIAAPRARTRGKALDGRAFLHDYDWKADRDFGVLELILTAPVVVASWISLQYYGSTVAPAAFGGGDKLLHNVTGGIGVVEGNGGQLRAGLPWQSIHDGEHQVHEPQRLTVCIEAPREAIGAILGRHDEVRALFDNRWLHLIGLDDTGRMAWRYAGDLEWTPMAPLTEADAVPASGGGDHQDCARSLGPPKPGKVFAYPARSLGAGQPAN